MIGSYKIFIPLFAYVCRVALDETRLLGWNVPPEELSTIPEHWLTQNEPNASLHYLLGTLYVAFTIVALIGNGLVLWIFTWCGVLVKFTFTLKIY